MRSFRRVPRGPFAVLALALVAVAAIAPQRLPSPGEPGPPGSDPEREGSPPTLAATPAARTPAAGAEDGSKRPEALDPIALASADVAAEQFVAARTKLDAFAAEHAALDAGDAARLEAAKAEFGRRRSAYFSSRVLLELRSVLAQSIRARVADASLPYHDIQSWMRKECGDRAIEAVAEAFRRKDPQVTVDELFAWLEARPRDEASWATASYGRGSGLVEPSGRAGGPSRDGWWRDATVDERTDFFLASFVEKSGLFESVRERAGNELLVRWR